MDIKLYKEPGLERPDLIASWPGIGNIGVAAVDTLRETLGAEELGEIKPWEFFYPNKVSIKDGLLEELRFPSNRFYFKRLGGRDLILFIGEEQPAGGRRMYGSGKKAYEMANLVLDVGAKIGCRRVYTSAACVSPSHHEMKPRAVSVAGSERLLREMREYQNVISMSEIEGRGEGTITGLNGLLLAMAKKRGLEAISLMGEIPDWLSGAPFPFPQASRSVLEVFSDILGIDIDLSGIDHMTPQIEELVQSIYTKFPAEIREKYDQRKSIAKPERITEEDSRWIKEHIDEFFKKGKGGNEGGTV